MYLKLMNAAARTHVVLDEVVSVSYERASDSEVFARITFADGETERYKLHGYAYLLNAEGKTIDQFAFTPPGTPPNTARVSGC